MRPARFSFENQPTVTFARPLPNCPDQQALRICSYAIRSLVRFPHSTHPRGASNLSVQRVQHFSSSGKIDDFVLGVECADDCVQARRTLLGAPLTCED